MKHLPLINTVAKLGLYVIGLAIVFGTIFLSVQQSLRLNANDPQIQVAEDVAAIVESGADAAAFFPEGSATVDPSMSLQPFIVIYDNDGKPLYGNGRIDNTLPAPPAGSFEKVRQNEGNDRVTWEPKSGTYVAAVVKRIEGGKSGYVVVARSLREVNTREALLMHIALVGWALSSVLLIGGALLLKKLRNLSFKKSEPIPEAAKESTNSHEPVV